MPGAEAWALVVEGEDWDKERDGERGHGSEGRVGTGGCLPHTSPSLGLTAPISVQGRQLWWLLCPFERIGGDLGDVVAVWQLR